MDTITTESTQGPTRSRRSGRIAALALFAILATGFGAATSGNVASADVTGPTVELRPMPCKWAALFGSKATELARTEFQDKRFPGVLKNLRALRVDSIGDVSIGTDCRVSTTLQVTYERAIRRNGHGSIDVTAAISLNLKVTTADFGSVKLEASEYQICLSGAQASAHISRTADFMERNIEGEVRSILNETCFEFGKSWRVV